MSMISRDERKKQKGIAKFVNSFKYPIKGLWYAYRNEQNLAVDVGVALIVSVLAIVLKVNGYEAALLALTIGLVISGELINTAFEAVVDLVTEEYHPLAKVAKDTASAACFVADMVAAGMWLTVFGPKIIALIG